MSIMVVGRRMGISSAYPLWANQTMLAIPGILFILVAQCTGTQSSSQQSHFLDPPDTRHEFRSFPYLIAFPSSIARTPTPSFYFSPHQFLHDVSEADARAKDDSTRRVQGPARIHMRSYQACQDCSIERPELNPAVQPHHRHNSAPQFDTSSFTIDHGFLSLPSYSVPCGEPIPAC